MCRVKIIKSSMLTLVAIFVIGCVDIDESRGAVKSIESQGVEYQDMPDAQISDGADVSPSSGLDFVDEKEWPVSFTYDNPILAIASTSSASLAIPRMFMRVVHEGVVVATFTTRPSNQLSAAPSGADRLRGHLYLYSIGINEDFFGQSTNSMVTLEFQVVRISSGETDDPYRVSNYTVEIWGSRSLDDNSVGRVVMRSHDRGQRPLFTDAHGAHADTPSDTTTPSQPPEPTP